MKQTDSPPTLCKAALSRLTKSELIARLESLPCAPKLSIDHCPSERLRLELSTHQIELESQNQELRESHQQIEAVRDRYADLYDFAPVGYVTLDKQGCVQSINLTGASMLASERKKIIGKPLILWLEKNCHDAFFRHLSRVFQSNERVLGEVTLTSPRSASRHISMISTSINQDRTAGQQCQMVLVDITQLKVKETELTQSRQALRNLSAHLDRIREDERRHLAREIHDDLGQKLTTMRFEVALLGNGGISSPTVSETAASLLRHIDETIEAVRTIASNLRPAVLDLGLAEAIEWQVQDFRRRTGIECSLKLSGEEIGLDNERATAVFRIIQESLTNIVRHSRASRIRLSMGMNGDNLLIQVSDNGVGIPADALKKSRSFGIAGMRERVLLMGGEMEIRSRSGRGTTIKISIPQRERRQINPEARLRVPVKPTGE